MTTEDAQAAENVALTDAEWVVEVLATHEMVGKSAPAGDDHKCRLITRPHDGCGCTRIVIGCTGCDWLTEADGTQMDAHRAHVAERVAARVAEAVERERAAWAAKIEALADSAWREPTCGCGHRADLHTMGAMNASVCVGGLGLCGCDQPFVRIVQTRLRALLTADDTKALADRDARVWDEAAELADTVIVSWSAVSGLHPTEPEPHPAALRAAGARRTLVVLRSRMAETFDDHRARLLPAQEES